MGPDRHQGASATGQHGLHKVYWHQVWLLPRPENQSAVGMHLLASACCIHTLQAWVEAVHHTPTCRTLRGKWEKWVSAWAREEPHTLRL